jgi:hypothetical protein
MTILLSFLYVFANINDFNNFVGRFFILSIFRKIDLIIEHKKLFIELEMA